MGKLIQGWILGSEKLVSCPVDWYSTVEVDYGSPRADERPLARAMVDQLLSYWRYPPALSKEIRIDICSTIPVAKGMASSTADIAATAVAAAHHLGHPLDEPTLARLCVLPGAHRQHSVSSAHPVRPQHRRHADCL
ncbi:threonine kinase in B12 biosynthesis [Klebsiella oxytoca]|nr:threonine kinase in B12 biosynthesis [Klebsiella oxytoca]